jgi:hypothetical protein
MSLGQLEIPEHDVYFTYGETVGASDMIPTCGIRWLYTPPPVHLPVWNVTDSLPESAYTTVSSWWGDDWILIDGSVIENSKRSAFMEYVQLPCTIPARVELALPLSTAEADLEDRKILERQGWSVRNVLDVTATPDAFRSYVQHSRGEFSCMKRGYSRLKTAWTSERTINYLASGRPAVVQNTGPSRFLPDDEGLFRFSNLQQASSAVCRIESDYEKHSRCARALAAEYFDGRKVLPRVLERALS